MMILLQRHFHSRTVNAVQQVEAHDLAEWNGQNDTRDSCAWFGDGDGGEIDFDFFQKIVSWFISSLQKFEPASGGGQTIGSTFIVLNNDTALVRPPTAGDRMIPHG